MLSPLPMFRSYSFTLTARRPACLCPRLRLFLMFLQWRLFFRLGILYHFVLIFVSLLFCFFWFYAFLFSAFPCFSAFIVLCFFASPLFCFFASSLLCFSAVLPLCFSAFLLFPAFLLFQLLCFLLFPDSLLTCFSVSLEPSLYKP